MTHIKYQWSSIISMGCSYFFSAFTLISVDVAAQTVVIKNSPRQFSVAIPTGWVNKPSLTANTRIAFMSPKGTPSAECAVTVQEFHALREHPQSYYDNMIVGMLDSKDIARQFSVQYNNVQVMSTGHSNVSGYPAMIANFRASTGTPKGELWMRMISVTLGTVPGLVWAISCGGMGSTLAAANKAYSYWQDEITKFTLNLKIY